MGGLSNDGPASHLVKIWRQKSGPNDGPVVDQARGMPTPATPKAVPTPATPKAVPTPATPKAVPTPATPKAVPTPATPKAVPTPATPKAVPTPATPKAVPTPATPKAVPTPATPKAVPTPPKAASPMEGGCSKCLRPREDKSFKLCARCRTMASVNAVRRRKVLQRKGACPKCSGPRDGDNLVCSGCLAKARKRYHQRKADRAKMAPAP